MNVWSKSFIVILTLFLNCQCAPRGPDLSQVDKPIGKLNYEIAEPLTAATNQNQQTQSTDNGILSLFGKFFQKNDILSSLMQMISKLNEKNLEDEKIKIYGEQYLKKPKNYQTNEKIIGDSKARAAKEIQLDEPIPISSGFNVDHSFSSVPKEMKLPPMDNEWKSTLFGPKGLLTEVFHFVNERRKQGFEKPLPQSDLPPGPTSEVDFAKVFDAILLKSGNGEFNEPKIPELPFIGICNRLNCGDIYKYVDQFKKSELFSNFQTALSLFQDPKGLDIIGELLENPDLIEQFAGKPENIAELLGKAGGPAKSKSGSKSHSMSVLPSDGDLGIDFGRELEPEKYAKKDGKPEFAASIDGGDYYSSVDKEPKKSSVDVDYEDTESVEVEESIVSTTTTLIPNDTRKKFERPLPELSFSVDETPKIGESVDEKLPEYGSRIEIEETAPVLTFKNGISYSKHPTAMERRFIVESNVTTTTSTTTPSTTLSTTVPTIKSTTKRISATTRRNFRKNNDYYAMYYDD